MDISLILNNLYETFSEHKRPSHFTDYQHCPECNDHDQMMLSATLETLDSEHLGNAGWSPFSFLTVDGFSHYMPRIMELAITGKGNVHGEFFLTDFLFHLNPSEDYDRFTSYSYEQCKSILDALLYTQEKYKSEIEDEFSVEDMESAISYWKTRCT